MHVYIQSDTPVQLAISGERFSDQHEGFTPDDMRAMVANWELSDKPTLPIEIDEHGGRIGGMMREVWTELAENGEMLLMALCEWTDEAAKAIAGGSLPNISVEAWQDVTDKRNGAKLEGWVLKAAALVPRGFYDQNDIKPVALSEPVGLRVTLSATKLADGLAAELKSKGSTNMAEETTTDEEQTAPDAELAEDDATEETTEATDEASDTDEGVDAAEDADEDSAETDEDGEPEASDEEGGTESVALSDDKSLLLSEQNRQLSDQVVTLSDQLATATAELTRRDSATFIELGQREGKISTKQDKDGTPAADVRLWSKLFLADAADAELALSDAPVVYPVGTVSGTAAVEPGDVEPKDIRKLAMERQSETGCSVMAAYTWAESQNNK